MRLVLGVFIGAWVARYLGPEEYGILGFAISFVSIFSAFTTLGIDWVAVRNLIVAPSQKNEIMGTSFVLRFFGTVFLLLLVWGALYLTSATKFEKSIVMVIAFGQVFTSYSVIDYYFRAEVKAKRYTEVNLSSFIVASVANIAFILLRLPLIWFAVVVTIENIVKIYFFVFFYSKETGTRFWQNFFLYRFFSFDTAISLLKDSWPILISGLITAFYMKIDQVLVKEILGNQALGYYSIAVRISEAWFFLSISITESLYPAILNAKKLSVDLYHSRLQKMYQILILIAVLIAIFMSFAAKPIIIGLYGDMYAETVGILIIYIWSNVFMFLDGGSWKWHVTENLQRIAIFRLLLGVILNLFLSILFIKLYGLMSVAYATLISYAFATYFGNLLVKKTRQNFKLQSLAIINVFNIKSYLQ